MLKIGKYAEAISDFMISQSQEADNLISDVNEARSTFQRYEALFERKEYDKAISTIRDIIPISPYFFNLREKIATSAVMLKDYEVAASEFTHAFKLSGNVTFLYLAARSHLASTSIEKGFSTVQNCLKSDPDHTFCLSLFKYLRKLDKQYKSALEAKQKSDALLKFWEEISKDGANLHHENYELTLGHKLLASISLAESYLSSSEYKSALKWVDIGLQIQDSNEKLLIMSIEAYAGKEQYDQGNFFITSSN